MNLLQHVINIREVIDRAFDGKLERLGIEASSITERPNLSDEDSAIRTRLINITNTHLEEKKGDYKEARSYTLKQCVFTMFNRLAALKLMENKEILVESIRQRPEYGGISQDHLGWLEEHPEGRQMDRQGLVEYFTWRFAETSKTIPLYKADYPYSLMPTADELNEIIVEFNAIDKDPDTAEAWKGDDILGWLYENFNVVEKNQFKESDEKTEYHKVSLQSQVYTPDWVVKFLVDNTLGKMYLEMYPDSMLGQPDFEGNYKYPIANKPASATREKKDVKEIRVIDPACGSGNFLLYAFDLLYDMYLNQNEQYGKNYNEKEIPKLIVENNLYGVDLDERAVQLAQIALMIKAREIGGRRAAVPQHTNIVSTNFFLPSFEDIKDTFSILGEWTEPQKATLAKIWNDLSNAYKFGTLVRVEEQLNGLLSEDRSQTLFVQEEMEELFSYRNSVITQIHNQVLQWSGKGSNNYTLVKMNDAVSFLEILSRKFDVVVANPPYTDSGDFGPELKTFIDENYKRPFRVNVNLYACFIKRCCELAGDNGKVGMVNPPTFMYIKSFEDTRKFILNNTHINLFVEWGYLGMFSPSARVDSAMFILELDSKDKDSTFIKLNDLYEMKRKEVLFSEYKKYLNGIESERVYSINQQKLKGIKTFPFIYWISDEFRAKFSLTTIEDKFKPASGAATSNNNKYLRFWWEVKSKVENIHTNNDDDWVFYAKGGPYNKWAGNIWLFINWKNKGQEIKNDPRAILRNPEYYFNKGVTYSASGSKGASFRLLPEGCIFDVGGASIFPQNNESVEFLLGLLNSKLSSYIVNCLNPTVNTQVGDMGRIPYIVSNNVRSEIATVERLATDNVMIKDYISQYSIIEPTFKESPISIGKDVSSAITNFYNLENFLHTIILLNEAVINSFIFKIYDLSESDRSMVLAKEGIPVGSLPISADAKNEFLKYITQTNKYDLRPEVKEYLDNLEQKCNIPRINEFESLYTNNKEWEEFCIQNNINPIEAWYQFKNSGCIPSQRTQTLAFELITDVIRTILSKDDDGVIPLNDRSGELSILPRIQKELVERGFSAAHISQIFSIVASNGNIDKYLREKFFAQLSDHLNLFMYLPKTPFIWHISSGEQHAVELFVSIYKWNRDTMMRIKSVYSANREAYLKDQYELLRIGDAQQKAEAVAVKSQIEELEQFCKKLDTLLASGYDPKIEDGVGKNMAPLQESGLLAYEVLNKGQLKKYLKPEW